MSLNLIATLDSLQVLPFSNFYTSLISLDMLSLFNNTTSHILNSSNFGTSSLTFSYNEYTFNKVSYPFLSEVSSTTVLNNSNPINDDVLQPLVDASQLTFPEYTSYDFLESEITRRQKKLPHLSRKQVFDLMYGAGSDSIEHALAQYDNILPTDYSNIYNHRGTLIDVTKLSHDQIMNLSVEVDDLFKFDSLDHIRSTYTLSVPTKKLYYPEPFIASPSFVHNDLGFLHILQYQY